MENQGWACFTTLFTQVDPHREFRHTDPGFYQVFARVCEQRQTHDLDMPSTNITSHFYTYVRDTCRFSSYSDAPAVIHLRNPRSGGTHRSTPIAFFVRGLTNGLFFSICACLAHMYMENQGGHISPHYS